jgi:hypothetical protein
MSSKRAKRRRGCGRKIKFPTEADATRRMHLVIRLGQDRGGTLAVYRCRGCGCFHFGHKARN